MDRINIHDQARPVTQSARLSSACLTGMLAGDRECLHHTNRMLETFSPQERIRWSLENLPDQHALASSFGIQSAVMLHMVNQIKPGLPVILVDTGYLFVETYQFIDQLRERLELNLHIFRPLISAAWQEAREGQLWLQGKSGIDRYNQLNKVEPMERGLESLGIATWYAGLRRQQSSSRENLPVLRVQRGRFKIHPIVGWHNRDVHRYLAQNDLPYHPLWEQGYVSVGDTHTSRPLESGMAEEQTRFFGIQRECGLHL